MLSLSWFHVWFNTQHHKGQDSVLHKEVIVNRLFRFRLFLIARALVSRRLRLFSHRSKNGQHVLEHAFPIGHIELHYI